VPNTRYFNGSDWCHRRASIQKLAEAIRVAITAAPNLLPTNDLRNTMKLPRRTFLHLAAGAAALPFVSQTGWAQAYPNRPVKILSGFPPGGLADLSARIPAQVLSER